MEGATVVHLVCPFSLFCLITGASQRDFCVWGGRIPGLGRGQAAGSVAEAAASSEAVCEYGGSIQTKL